MPHRDNSLWPLCSDLRALCVKSFSALLFFAAAISLIGCSPQSPRDPSSLTFLIESNPTNLDPRYATDAQSQRLDGLLFSSLLERDEQMNLHSDLAESWELPDPLTYVFYLRPGVRFNRRKRSGLFVDTLRHMVTASALTFEKLTA